MDWKQELLKRLDALASQLGATGAQLWAILLRQSRLEGFADLGDALFLAVFVYVLYRFGRRCWRESKEDKYNAGYVAGYIILGIFAGGFSIWSFCVLHTAVLELMNPGYYALEKLLQGAGH